MYHFLVATFFLGLMVHLHGGGFGLLAFRDHLVDLMLGFLILVLLPGTDFLACSQPLQWCIVLAFFLVASSLLLVGAGTHMPACVLFAVRCSIMLRREGLLDRRHRCTTSQQRRWSWYLSWFRRHSISRREHVFSLPVLLADTVCGGGRVISGRCYSAFINI